MDSTCAYTHVGICVYIYMFIFKISIKVRLIEEHLLIVNIPFLVYSSLMLTHSHTHVTTRRMQITGESLAPKAPPRPFVVSQTLPPAPRLSSCDLFSLPIALPFLEGHRNGIIQKLAFCVWVL